MELSVGQKIAYPNQGVCLVEEFKTYKVAGGTMSGYSLRVLNDNSTIFVPEASADATTRILSEAGETVSRLGRLIKGNGEPTVRYKGRLAL